MGHGRFGAGGTCAFGGARRCCASAGGAGCRSGIAARVCGGLGPDLLREHRLTGAMGEMDRLAEAAEPAETIVWVAAPSGTGDDRIAEDAESLALGLLHATRALANAGRLDRALV